MIAVRSYRREREAVPAWDVGHARTSQMVSKGHVILNVF